MKVKTMFLCGLIVCCLFLFGCMSKSVEPVLQTIGDQSITEGTQCTIELKATDLDGDTLTFTATNLPEGATISGNIFTWKPGYLDAGEYFITFSVTDGQFEDSETVKLTVLDAVFLVPETYPTIQAAIDAAADGVVIKVAPGTYLEHISFKGKAITLTSNDPSDGAIVANTIIDGNNTNTVVRFESGETSNSILTGFTIKNGYSETTGGGIYVAAASTPTITGNIIMKNGGSGIYIVNASPTITDNQIKLNSAMHGAGIWVDNFSAPFIAENTIWNNTASYNGGGIYVTKATPAIEENTIALNLSKIGGGIAVDECNNLRIWNNSIFDNAVESAGGGLYIKNSLVKIEQNELVRNKSIFGGGVYFNTCLVGTEFSNNTVQYNLGNGNGGGIHLENSSINIEENFFLGNITYGQGGAIELTFSTSAFIHGNTIADHTSGSGIYVSSDSIVLYENYQPWPRYSISPDSSEATNTYANNAPYHVYFAD